MTKRTKYDDTISYNDHTISIRVPSKTGTEIQMDLGEVLQGMDPTDISDYDRGQFGDAAETAARYQYHGEHRVLKSYDRINIPNDPDVLEWFADQLDYAADRKRHSGRGMVGGKLASTMNRVERAIRSYLDDVDPTPVDWSDEPFNE